MNESSELSSLLAELTTTRAALASTVARMQRKHRTTIGLSLLTIVFLIGYLGYAFYRFGHEVTPNLVAATASRELRDRMPSAKDQLEDTLRKRAPSVVSDAFKRLKSMPDEYTQQLQDNAIKQMDARMPEVQDKMYAAMHDAVQQASAHTAKVVGDGSKDDTAGMQASLAAVGDVYAKETIDFVNQIHGTYTGDATTFMAYLDRLATSPNLDRRDRLHRDMFRTVFALVRERAVNPRPGDAELTILKGKPS